MKTLFLLLNLALGIFPMLLYSQAFKYELNSLNEKGTYANWTFGRVGEEAFNPAKVPGCVHTDLFQNKLIPDPFMGDNEKKIQWIVEVAWEYRAEFILNEFENYFKNSEADLVFEGLDTYAEVWLNDHKILTTNNMFRTWKTPIRPLLKVGKNVLKIRFYPAVLKGKALKKTLSYTLPGDEKVFTRKAQYQYGWDWGPRLVTCGVWKPVYILFYQHLVIENAWIYPQKIDKDTARLMCEVTCNFPSRKLQPATQLKLKDEKGEVLGTLTFDNTVGKQAAFIPFVLSNPKLWEADSPFLYPFTVSVEGYNGFGELVVYSSLTLKAGIKESDIVQKPDTFGRGFYIEVNKNPIFIRGANWIPAHSFPSELQPKDYLRLLVAAKESNINMLRVWGGGIYEPDIFYDICDSLGIMVWQDFMYACAMYPGDSLFLHNAAKEAEEQIVRLRNHPCITLWCGNNEISEGWHNWGWQKQYLYSSRDSQKIWQDYLTLFEAILPDLVTKYDNRPYHPSSPSNGWGREKAYTEGDLHYWGVWWGLKDYRSYIEKTGRFVSEYGMQAFPDWETVKTFGKSEEIHLKSSAFRNHQKHPTGFFNLRTYVAMDYRYSRNLRKYGYITQLMQADAIRTAIEAHRRAKPYCMGTLYWQFNDCWPVISWSGMDYYGRYKALFYTVKEAYSSVAISTLEEKDSLSIYLLSEAKSALTTEWKVNIMDFEGQRIDPEFSVKTETPAGLPVLIYRKALPSLQKSKPYFVAITAKISGYSGIDSLTKVFLPEKPKHIRFPDPEFSILSTQDTEVICLKSKRFAKGVHLYVEEEYVPFEKNYFDLPPNTPVYLRLPKGVSLSRIKVESYR